MNNNIVSVIVPVYNAKDYIIETIQSILNQTYKEIEVVICDNCSTDDTLLLLEKYKDDRRIKLLSCIKKGVSYTRNKAIENAKGRYIAFLDSDDLWYKYKIEKQINFMKQNNVALCYTEYDYINDKSKKLKRKSRKIKQYATYKSLLKNNYIGTLTVIIDKKIVKNIEFKNFRHEDLAFWLKLIKQKYYLAGIKEVLASYRISDKSLSSNKKEAAKWRYDIYRKVEGFNVLKSLYYFIIYAINSLIRKI